MSFFNRVWWRPAVPEEVDEELGFHVEQGRFGAHMHVHLVNDGPFTILLEG